MDFTSSPNRTREAALGALHAIAALLAVVGVISLFLATVFTESPLNVLYIVGQFCRMYGIFVFPIAAVIGTVARLYIPRPYGSVVIWTTMPVAAVVFPAITLIALWQAPE